MDFYGGVLPLIILIAGMLLIILEIIVPGFGLPGISGIILIVLGISSFTNSLSLGLIYLIFAILVSGLLGYLIGLWLKKTGRMGKIVLENKLNREKGYIPARDMQEYLNMEGITLTDLRPSGFVSIEGVKLDAITSGEYIKKDEAIVVVRVEGAKIIVRSV